MENKKTVILKDLTANPAPLGLLGFGLTTVLLNIHNAGFFPINSMILAMGIAYGGIAQILACGMEFKKGNTFGTVAFGSYGLFWWSFVLLIILPKLNLAAAPDKLSLAAYLFMWGLFTLVMFFGTLKLSRGLQVVFFSLAVLFFLLALGDITGNATITIIAGYEGIFTGFAAIYVGLAQVLNETYGKELLPT
ncbi:MAG: acetate uptake transporter [Methanobacteriaceae archaeon]|jgi:succinate-acetate transporter protein|nr:acetate uptake transporter [Methanobacteriaceae archaeon]MDP3035091.1 acetate uptake transporter [Methanobacteriaceae archaeon]MDP3484860.1 acetate uptake transporter [Methanobacteriaceae archaeon]MDP3623325.1 acetate uptake transporter [Methanobacteriaceae archaeon]